MSGNNISPLDGRYREELDELREYFTEDALNVKRVRIEIIYVMHLNQLINKSNDKFLKIDHMKIQKNIGRVKEIEKTTNHDVKAVEYYVREILDEYGYGDLKHLIHFGLTSQDINSLAMSTIIDSYLEYELLPFLEIDLLNDLKSIIDDEQWNIPMMSKTHGQWATPTNFKKEFMVFSERLTTQIEIIKNIKKLGINTKFGGATGGLNSLYFAYPDIDWKEYMTGFCRSSFGLKRTQHTTQIDHYDNFSEIFDALKRVNTILIDMCQDIWLYISMDYIKLKINEDETGSSTMPHKVNPIDFENAEGNFKLSNCLLNFLSEKLPVSRLQRDLTDSTVSRNIGVAFGHSDLAVQSLLKGLEKIQPNTEKIKSDLNSNYSVLGEAVQTVLRKYGIVDAYEIVKEKTRNNSTMDKDSYVKMIQEIKDIDGLKLDEIDLQRLLDLTPETYKAYF